jgi:hypothetical protein
MNTLPCGVTIPSPNYGPATLTPGIYCFTNSANFVGTITLNGQGDPNAPFYIITSGGGSITFNFNILVINGANPCNVYFITSQSVNINTAVTINGYILSSQTISITSGVVINGGVFAFGSLNINSLTVNMCVVTACPSYFLCPLNLGVASNFTLLATNGISNVAGGTTTGDVATTGGSISAFPPVIILLI